LGGRGDWGKTKQRRRVSVEAGKNSPSDHDSKKKKDRGHIWTTSRPCWDQKKKWLSKRGKKNDAGVGDRGRPARVLRLKTGKEKKTHERLATS